MASDAAPPTVPPDGVNPYLPTPVARVTDSGAGTVTVSTDAVRRAVDFLDPYLTAPVAGVATPRGRVMTIVGDFGAGKSHLAIALLRRAQATSVPAPDTVYLDAPSGSFVDLYRRFVSHLDRGSVIELVRAYHAEVVAAELSGRGHTDEVPERLRAGGVEPAQVVRELRLPGGELLRRTREVLARVTADPDLGAALTLLLEPSAQAVVWDWLSGNPPNEFLQERGIARTIGTDGPALHALLAVTRLYRDRGRRFLLVIDDFDRVLSTIDSRVGLDDRLGPFKHMLESIGESGAFVVLAGAGDMLRAVDTAVRQRMGPVVEMTPMSATEVREFIRESHRNVRGDGELDPFTPEAIDQVATLTRGVPRRFITLCHHLYRYAQRTGQWITPETVRQVGSSHYDLASVLDVRREVYQILSRKGLRITRGRQREPDGEPQVDYWISDPGGEFRCAILVTGAMLSVADLHGFRRRLRAARAEAHDVVEAVVVVVGYLTDPAAAEVTGLTGRDPVEYGSGSFAETLTAVVAGVLRRFDEATTAQPLDVIRYQVDRITRQQANTLEMIEYVVQRLAGFGETTERQLTDIRRELAEATRAVPAEEAAPTQRARPDAGDSVLATVERLFASALETLATIDRMDVSLAAAFNPSGGSRTGLPSGVRAVQARLRQQEGFSPLGTAVFLEKLVMAFRAAFLDWYDSSRVRAAGRPSAADRDRLDRLCTSYEALYHDIPLDELKKLVESTARYPDEGDTVRQWDWPTIRLDDVRRTFAELGVQVGRAVGGAYGGWEPHPARHHPAS
jgi:hypothetical protein